MMPSVADVVAALSEPRFTAVTEDALQLGIAEVLDARFPGCFEREYRLSRRDRPDFFCVDAGIVIEIKIRTSGGTAPKVFAQLARYAEHKVVREIVFATPSRRIASRIGDVVGGKTITPVVLFMGY